MGGEIHHRNPLGTAGIEQADTGVLVSTGFDLLPVTLAAHPPIDRGLFSVAGRAGSPVDDFTPERDRVVPRSGDARPTGGSVGTRVTVGQRRVGSRWAEMLRVVTDIDGMFFCRHAELSVTGHLTTAVSDAFVVDQI